MQGISLGISISKRDGGVASPPPPPMGAFSNGFSDGFENL